MKGVAVTFMLIMIVVALVTSFLVGWAIMNTTSFFDINEISSVKKGFEECNDKILETARTSLSNKCMFPVSRGIITASTSDISYQIITPNRVCDESPWVLIDPEKNTWQNCDLSGKNAVFGLKWNYTNISFQFEQTGSVQINGQSSSTIEISRLNVNDSQITLLLKVY